MMNERILELLKQATYDVLGVNQVDQQLFAELIVEECMSNLHLNGYDDAMNQVKQHFGADE
jgi:hypothetical protein